MQTDSTDAGSPGGKGMVAGGFTILSERKLFLGQKVWITLMLFWLINDIKYNKIQ